MFSAGADRVPNIAFLAVAAVLIWRYFRRGGGLSLLRVMNKPTHGDHSPTGEPHTHS